MYIGAMLPNKKIHTLVPFSTTVSLAGSLIETLFALVSVQSPQQSGSAPRISFVEVESTGRSLVTRTASSGVTLNGSLARLVTGGLQTKRVLVLLFGITMGIFLL